MTKKTAKEILGIKMLRSTVASGQDLFEKKSYRVPEDVSAKDARYLISLRKAESTSGKPAGKTNGKSDADSDTKQTDKSGAQGDSK